MWNYALKNCICYNNGLSNTVDNYQRMFGTKVEIFRLDDRERDDAVLAYGGFHSVKGRFMSKLFDVMLMCNPTELYQTYSTSSGNSEMDVYTKSNKLLEGDIIKYEWVDGTVLEFEVMEPPKTYGNMFYQYRIKSMYQVNSK